MRAIVSLAFVMIAGASVAQPAQEGSQSTENAAFVNGTLTVPGADKDGQTVPAKFSERNAKIDDMPIMAYPLALNDEQRRRIFEVVMKTQAPVSTVQAKPAQELPGTTALTEMPEELMQDAPALRGMSYLKTSDGVLIVRAPTMIVVDAITR